MNPLRHRRLRALLDAFVDGELDGTTARTVDRHVRTCWWCSGEVHTQRLVAAVLRRRSVSR